VTRSRVFGAKQKHQQLIRETLVTADFDLALGLSAVSSFERGIVGPIAELDLTYAGRIAVDLPQDWVQEAMVAVDCGPVTLGNGGF
jgi:hypothetical protein